jgi:signal transduction histidine kinase
MWFEKIRNFFRTSIWRFTLFFTLIVLFTTTATLGLVYYSTLDAQKRQLENSLRVAAQAYKDLATVESMTHAEFSRVIDQRTRSASSLVLSLSSVEAVKGNLDILPKNLPDFPQIGQFPIAVTDAQGNPTIELAIGTRLETNFGSMAIGVLEGDYQSRREDFFMASAIALSVALILTFLLGLLFNWRILGRLHTIREFTRQVKLGRMSTRLPISPRGDEYDLISVDINGMLDEIDELVQSVAGVTDNIAHDLRTPLSRIRLSLERAQISASNNFPDDVANAVLQDIDQLLETFEAMLELSRLERGITVGSKESCNIVTIAEDVHGLLLPVAEAEGHTIELCIESDLRVMGDKSLLFRAVYNLLENAIKYCSAKGVIVLGIVDHSLYVADNGPGILPAERDKVFQRLYRLDDSRHQPGSGLGLSIVKAIADLHGAAVELADNHPGLRVTLRFPN